MKALRILVCIVFVAVTAFYSYVRLTNRKDNTVPLITCSEKSLSLSVKDTESDILKYASAYDEKDGDITSRVLIENISPYITDGKTDITFVVSDLDNNISRLVVPAVYTDYYSPKFIIKKPLIVPLRARNFDFTDYIEVDDCIDGKTLSNSIITVSDFDITLPGNYSLTLKTTNSRFDSSTLAVNISVSPSSVVNPVNLKTYSVYCRVGDNIDFNSYIADGESDVSVNSEKVDLTHAGVHEAVYSAEGRDATPFVVICEE